jgi:hypothetical protein
MDAFLMGLYVLVWPVVSAAVLALIWVAMIRETRAAREKGEDII